MSFWLEELARHINGELIGDPTCEISKLEPLKTATQGALTFVTAPQYVKLIPESKASAFIVYEKIELPINQIVIKNTKKAMAMLISFFYPSSPIQSYISSQAMIEEGVSVHPSCRIEAFASIQTASVIGSGCMIHSGVRIGRNCKIGSRCVLYPNVVLYDHTVLGDDILIHAGSIIGSDGYGYYEEKQQWIKIDHIGHVVIGDRVEIGSNVCIDRGCLGNTTIGTGTKIDNLTHIAHNCTIGGHCAITGLVGFAGSVTLEDHVQIAGQSGLNGHITIGKNTVILGRSGVTKSVPANSVISGYPAKSHHQALKEQATLNRLLKKS